MAILRFFHDEYKSHYLIKKKEYSWKPEIVLLAQKLLRTTIKKKARVGVISRWALGKLTIQWIGGYFWGAKGLRLETRGSISLFACVSDGVPNSDAKKEDSWLQEL